MIKKTFNKTSASAKQPILLQKVKKILEARMPMEEDWKEQQESKTFRIEQRWKNVSDVANKGIYLMNPQRRTLTIQDYEDTEEQAENEEENVEDADYLEPDDGEQVTCVLQRILLTPSQEPYLQ